MDKWYLWRRQVQEKKYPWNRSLLNEEFLRSEAKRINQCKDWYSTYLRHSRGSSLQPVEMYSLPTRIDYTKTQNITSGQTVKVLSALRNSFHTPIIAIFNNTDKPKDYSMINIKSSTKKNIVYGHYGRRVEILYGIVVNDWEYLPIDSIYYTDTKRPNFIRDYLKSYFIGEKTFPEAFQSPILSSPPIHQQGGGVSLALEFEERGYGKDVCYAIQYFLPPEYRSIPPPKGVYNGKWEEFVPGLEAHVAERIINQSAIVKSSISESVESLVAVAEKRTGHRGEYSSVGGLFIEPEIKAQETPRLVNEFFNFDISLCDVENLYNYNLPIDDFLSHIDEEHWNTIVGHRQVNPILEIDDQRLLNLSKSLLKWFDADIKSYSDRVGDVSPEVFKLTAGIDPNTIAGVLQRESQSVARSNYHDTVEYEDLDIAKRNFQNRITIMLEKPEIQEGIREYSKRGGKLRTQQIKGDIVKGTLRQKPSLTIKGLWEELEPKGLFENRDDMINTIERLRKVGEVYYNNGYHSVN